MKTFKANQSVLSKVESTTGNTVMLMRDVVLKAYYIRIVVGPKGNLSDRPGAIYQHTYRDTAKEALEMFRYYTRIQGGN